MRPDDGPATPAVVSCRDLCIAYDGADVVHDVSLTITRGMFVPFVGANGAGKTTLLQTVLGLLKPRRGHMTTDFGGHPPGYVPQQKVIDPLFPVSARQLITMGLYPELGLWRRPSAGQHVRIDDALERFGLTEHQHKVFGELSGGMKQKTLVARAFVSGAEVFIMDEPTSELDADSEHEVLNHLHELSRKEGKTVLIAHHGVERVAGLASVVCRMDHGRAVLTDCDGTVLPAADSATSAGTGEANHA